MKCKRCEKDADLDVNNESLCYDCAVVRVHELIEDAIAKDAIVREANLLARVAELSCRIPYDRRETMDAAEKYALVRGFRAIAAVIGGTDELSLADVVKKVTAIVARVAELEAEVERLKASVPIPTVVSSTVTKARRALRTVLGVASPGSAFRQAADLAIGALTSLEAERDQLRARVAELVRHFEQLGTERDQLRDRVVELEAELRDRVAESEKLKNRVTDLEQALQTLSYNHAQDGRGDSR